MANDTNPKLTSNDTAVLSKVFDPESVPSAATVLIDPSLPADPNIQDQQTLATIALEETAVITSIEKSLRTPNLSSLERNRVLAEALNRLSSLIATYPNSASLRNNRAQLFRLRYGDTMFISSGNPSNPTDPSSPAATALSDLDKAIRLLSPLIPQSAISPTQCRVLAQAYTQRAALFYAASKQMAASQTVIPSLTAMKEWQLHDFEEAASKDFFMGGRYGNEIGKALAVHTNPTAKLCGQMVQEAMKREFTSIGQTSN